MSTLKERLVKQQEEPVKFPGLRVSVSRIHLDPRNDEIYGKWNPDINTKDKELLESIREIGLMQAITVRTHPTLPDEYILLSGHRRYAACKTLNKSRIECMVLTPDNEEELARVDMGLVQTNSTVRDRTPGMIAKEVEFQEKKLKTLQKTNPEAFSLLGTSMREAVAKATGISQHTVANVNIIRNNVTPEIYEAYKEDKITQKEALEEAEKKLSHRKEKKKSSVEVLLSAPDPVTKPLPPPLPPTEKPAESSNKEDLDFYKRILTKKMEDTLERLNDNIELFADTDIRDLIIKLSSKVRTVSGLKEVED